MTDKLHAWCEQLGFDRAREGATTCGGVRDGVPVDVAWQRGGQYATMRVIARLAHPVDLGLDVHLSGISDWPQIVTGHGDFDGIFSFYVAKEERALASGLLDDAARGALQALAVAGYPTLDDGAVHFAFDSASSTFAEFAGHVDRCVEAARSIDARAAMLPVPNALRGLEFVDALLVAAKDLGFDVRHNALTLSGETASARLEMRLRANHAWLRDGVGASTLATAGCALRVTFHEPLAMALRLEPATAGDRMRELVGLGDVHLGDDAFDRAWTLRTDHAEGARAALRGEAREALDRLAALGVALTLTEVGLTGSAALPTSPDAGPEILRLVDGLREQLRPRVAAGPYR